MSLLVLETLKAEKQGPESANFQLAHSQVIKIEEWNFSCIAHRFSSEKEVCSVSLSYSRSVENCRQSSSNSKPWAQGHNTSVAAYELAPNFWGLAFEGNYPAFRTNVQAHWFSDMRPLG